MMALGEPLELMKALLDAGFGAGAVNGQTPEVLIKFDEAQKIQVTDTTSNGDKVLLSTFSGANQTIAKGLDRETIPISIECLSIHEKTGSTKNEHLWALVQRVKDIVQANHCNPATGYSIWGVARTPFFQFKHSIRRGTLDTELTPFVSY